VKNKTIPIISYILMLDSIALHFYQYIILDQCIVNIFRINL